ncbi:MAG TPA: ABC transporter ATP-binding protein, partial [Chloroflexota bacterium]|nr:ABC transporter ATP-binding protein [Chloroflexota bacterium]
MTTAITAIDGSPELPALEAPAVRASNVTWNAGSIEILRGIGLEVERGTLAGLIGPNGSGKSSLLRTIYRVIRPHAGLITLDEEDVWKMSLRRAAQRTAAVLQESTGEFEFTVEEVVSMGRTPHKGPLDRETAEDREIVFDALQRVGLTHFTQRTFATLSGGEKQRVLIARALAQKAQFLVLDEPTNHLDIRHQLDVLELVRGLGVTALAALHDLNLAAQYCDRLFVLSQGKVVAWGAPAEVLQPALLRDVF